MKAKNYFILILLLNFCLPQVALPQLVVKEPTDVLEQIHWIIERSDINTVKKKFQEFCEKNNFPSVVSSLKDGTYRGATPYDDYGYSHVVVFEMKKGKMISIDYDEVHRDGHAKQSGETYGKQMMQSGTSPAIAYPKYEKAMIGSQNFNDIDAVSGATYSLFRFRLAILYAIHHSKRG